MPTLSKLAGKRTTQPRPQGDVMYRAAAVAAALVVLATAAIF